MSPNSNPNPTMDVYSAVRWSAASKYGAQAMQMVVSLLLARLLAPEYFGLVAMAMVITGFVSIFSNLGFSSAIIQRKQVSNELLSTLFWVNLGICVMLTGTLTAVSPLVAWFYQDSRVAPIVAVSALGFLLAGFTMVPGALLVRQMAFNKLALREIASLLVSGVTSITLALLGWGVWALVVGPLAGSATALVLLNLLQPFRPRFVFDRQGLRECLSFGLNITGFGIFNYFARNADKLIIGAMFGPISLGYYTLAYRLMLLPRDWMSNLVTRVLFPALSRMQDDDERLANAYLRACGAIAFVTFPLMTGMAIVAHPFVEVVLGDKWLPAVPLIWILAPIGALQSIGTTTGQLFLAKGKSNWMLWCGIGGGSFLIAGIIAGIPWGVAGVAASYAIASAIWTPCSFWLISRWGLVSTFSLRRLSLSLLPYATLALLMAIGVLACQFLLYGINATPLLRLSVCVPAGVLFYAAASVWVQPPAFRDFLRLLPPRQQQWASRVFARHSVGPRPIA